MIQASTTSSGSARYCRAVRQAFVLADVEEPGQDVGAGGRVPGEPVAPLGAQPRCGIGTPEQRGPGGRPGRAGRVVRQVRGGGGGDASPGGLLQPGAQAADGDQPDHARLRTAADHPLAVEGHRDELGRTRLRSERPREVPGLREPDPGPPAVAPAAPTGHLDEEHPVPVRHSEPVREAPPPPVHLGHPVRVTGRHHVHHAGAAQDRPPGRRGRPCPRHPAVPDPLQARPLQQFVRFVPRTRHPAILPYRRAPGPTPSARTARGRRGSPGAGRCRPVRKHLAVDHHRRYARRR